MDVAKEPAINEEELSPLTYVSELSSSSNFIRIQHCVKQPNHLLFRSYIYKKEMESFKHPKIKDIF